MCLVQKMLWLMLSPDLSVLLMRQLQTFCLSPSSLPSTSSTPPLVLISPPCLLSKLPALPFKPSYPACPSQMALFTSAGPLSSVMCPPDLPDLWFLKFSRSSCSSLFMASLILEFVLQEDFSLRGLCGLVWPEMLASGQDPASNVNRARFKHA